MTTEQCEEEMMPTAYTSMIVWLPLKNARVPLRPPLPAPAAKRGRERARPRHNPRHAFIRCDSAT